MTSISNLSRFELAAINQSRREEGKPPLGSFTRAVQATAIPFVQTITA
jgi:hypothetical protein